MLDLVNLNIGGSGFGGDRTGHFRGARGGQHKVTVVAPPKAPETENAKFAKRIVRVFDTAGFDYYGVAAALWDHAPDAVKVHLYTLVDKMLDVAADKHESGLDYTLIEREIGINASVLRRHLWDTGFIDNPNEQE